MGARFSACKRRKAPQRYSVECFDIPSLMSCRTAKSSDTKENVRLELEYWATDLHLFMIGQKIFALIIGIDDYGHHGQYNLKGAKADADKFETFVREKLKAPETNILSLRDKYATRSAIINRFRSLENNEDIVRNDATIIIYYAGHGAVANKPEDWTDWPAPENKLEMLCPADISLPDSSASTGLSSKVDGIPDRTISRLLLDISAAKGDNIILILDCCHSAGLNRGVNPDVRPRQIFTSIPIEISPDCDSAIYSREIRQSSSGEATNKSGFSGSLWYSHVLLAACSRREISIEEYQEGVFTRALLKALYDNNIKELTLKQTPHWDGRHTDRRIFCSPEEASDRSRVICDRDVPESRRDNCLRLMSGSLHGITQGSEFKIYGTGLASDTEPLATASVDEVHDTFVSYLTISPPDKHIFARDGNVHFWYARLTKAAKTKFAVYCKDSKFLTSVQTEGNCATELMVTVDFASTSDEASLLLKVENGTVSFERQGEERDLLLGGGRRLSLEHSSYLHNAWKEDRDLYVYLLCFDASTLEIVVFYSPPMGNGPVDSHLGENSPLILGPGSNDMRPVAFDLPSGQNVDVCFFQFIVATEPVEINSMSQSSLENLSKVARGAIFQKADPVAPTREWASMTIPVILRQLEPGAG
ncbi:caspase domain-containing protein [Armillaria mellea]|nr:caspase domain-containing protein [Armillaria mellea]